MKTIFLWSAVLTFSMGFAQTLFYNPTTEGRMIYTKSDGKKFEGSPYFEEVFRPVRFDNGSVRQLRYNAYTDALEYTSEDNATMMLLPTKDSIIRTADNRHRYVFTGYMFENKLKDGYLLHLGNFNNVTLYARHSVTLTAESKPSNGYSTYRPAAYKKMPVQYMVKVGDNTIVPFSTKKKELAKLYPDKETQISDYLKKNNVDAENEAQMTEFARFLGTL